MTYETGAYIFTLPLKERLAWQVKNYESRRADKPQERPTQERLAHLKPQLYRRTTEAIETLLKNLIKLKANGMQGTTPHITNARQVLKERNAGKWEQAEIYRKRQQQRSRFYSLNFFKSQG